MYIYTRDYNSETFYREAAYNVARVCAIYKKMAHLRDVLLLPHCSGIRNTKGFLSDLFLLNIESLCCFNINIVVFVATRTRATAYLDFRFSIGHVCVYVCTLRV